MGDFQRALYDYSVAIRIAKDNGEEPRVLAEYYSKFSITTSNYILFLFE